jgi:tRNA(Ile)-lysidine synthase
MLNVDALADFFSRHQVAGRVTVALSGGIDSMVLLDLVAKVANRRAFSGKNAPNGAPVLEFDALHVHHGLSPSADKWAEFCERECVARNLSLHVERVQLNRDRTGGLGVEGAARAARYAAFGQHGGPFILAAQHADDQAETVLHQLLRGGGLAALAGMGDARQLDHRQVLLRPFLAVPRAAIEAYAREQSLSWVEDDSNTDTRYARNHLRHAVLPTLAERYPHYRESIARAARHAAEGAMLNEALAALDLRWDGRSAQADGLDALGIVRQTNALYWWLKWMGARPVSHEELKSWAGQLFRPSPTDKPHQAGGHGVRIRRRNHALHFEAASPEEPPMSR